MKKRNIIGEKKEENLKESSDAHALMLTRLKSNYRFPDIHTLQRSTWYLCIF